MNMVCFCFLDLIPENCNCDCHKFKKVEVENNGNK